MPDLDFDLDRALAPLLEPPLGDPEALPQLERRAARSRRRRWASRLSAGATAALVAVVVVAVLPDSADQVVRTTPPTDTPSDGRPPADPFGPLASLRDLRTIHRGALGSEEWQLLIGFDDEGRPCVALHHEMSEQTLCGNDFYPWRPFEEGSTNIADTELRFGPTVPAVARVRLLLDDGELIDATLLEVPGYPVKVWFAPVPEGKRVRMVAPVDANGLPAGG